MKFRAKMDMVSMQNLTKIVNTISKSSKTCILRITTCKVYFIMLDGITSGGVGIWCELTKDQFFDEYNMEGISAEHNEIYLEVLPESMAKVLKLVQTAKALKIKLTKKNTPCLTFEAELPSVISNSRIVVHDIPVNVVPRRQWDDYQEPAMPDFDISIFMPSLKMLKTIVEKMKNLSTFVVISANKNGELKFCVEADLVTVKTHFSRLDIPDWDDNADNNGILRQMKDEGEVRIDIRPFAHFLSGHQMNPTRVLCNIKSGRVIQFVLLHHDTTLQYFIPASER